jgi:hypothetical protein
LFVNVHQLGERDIASKYPVAALVENAEPNLKTILDRSRASIFDMNYSTFVELIAPLP